MADKNIQIKQRNGATWDNLYPKTKAAIVILDDGTTTASAKFASIDTALGGTASTAYVDSAVANVVNGSPAALDTLNELALALGDDANFATTMTNNLATKAPLASPALTGVPTAPTAAADTTTTQLATTAFVVGQASATAPKMDGAATIGTSKKYSRDDHIHPSDTSRAPLASPTFTGTPAAPTAVAGTNTTQLATTAFVKAACDTVDLDVPIIDSVEPTTGNLWYQVI
jgi:hypothetical protein